MITKAIMVIWIGMSQTQALATQKFDSVGECDSAKAAISQHYENKWSSILDSDIECIPYEASE